MTDEVEPVSFNPYEEWSRQRPECFIPLIRCNVCNAEAINTGEINYIKPDLSLMPIRLCFSCYERLMTFNNPLETIRDHMLADVVVDQKARGENFNALPQPWFISSINATSFLSDHLTTTIQIECSMGSLRYTRIVEDESYMHKERRAIELIRESNPDLSINQAHEIAMSILAQEYGSLPLNQIKEELVKNTDRPRARYR